MGIYAGSTIHEVAHVVGAGLLPSYENFSLILEKLPPTIGYLTIDFPNTGRKPAPLKQTSTFFCF